MNSPVKERVESILLDSMRTGRVPGYHLRKIIFSFTRKDMSGGKLRIEIKRLREEGHLILADVNGYFLAQTQKEVKDYILCRKIEIDSELKVLNDLLDSPQYKKLKKG
jgi:hypothetical protein